MARFGAILAFGCLLYFTNSVLCQIDIGLPKSEAEAIGAVETVAAIAAIQRQMRAAMAPGGAPFSAPAPDEEFPSWAGNDHTSFMLWLKRIFAHNTTVLPECM
jgi:hypothetical protein